MITSLEIRGFRAFEAFTVDDLDRINLFVGKNNSGKTTILEAAEMLVSENSAGAIVRCAMRRGEILVQTEEDRPSRHVDISHLFHGHECKLQSSFSIRALEGGANVSLDCDVVPYDKRPNGEKELFSETYSLEPRVSLLVKCSSMDEPVSLPLSMGAGLSVDYLRHMGVRPNPGAKPTSFVGTETLDVALAEFWDSIALTEEEFNVIETLKILEPGIERIAFLSQRYFRYRSLPGGIYVKLKYRDNRIPLGSLGDGIRHLLIMALTLSRSRHGFVMIDEIDTGLHHSVMTDMWRVLIKTAQRLDVQVFVTTHSLDCLRSLASLYSREPALCQNVRVHRADSTRAKTVVYQPDEIETAAKQDVELRG